MARRRRSSGGTKKVWTSIVGDSNVSPGGSSEVDLIPPNFRTEEFQDTLTLLRIRGQVTIVPGESAFAASDNQRLSAVGRAAIWADHTGSADPEVANDIADQGLIWMGHLGFYSMTQVQAFGVPPDVRIGFAYNSMHDRVEIDTKAMRRFKALHPATDPLRDLVYVFDRAGDEGGGTSDLIIRHYLTIRMLWLIR